MASFRSRHRSRAGAAHLAGVALLVTAGVIILAVAAWLAQNLRSELTSWREVDAHVDSARVAPWTNVTKQASYAERLWLSYTLDGRRRARVVTGAYTNDYAAQIHAAQRDEALGRVRVIIDPHDANHVKIGAGYTLSFFALPAVIGAIGAFLVLIGFSTAVSRVRSRRAGPSASASSARPVAIGVLAMVFLCVAGVLGHAAFAKHATWMQTRATIDSADVVQRKNDSQTAAAWLYAPRLWVAYTVKGTPYHRPVLTGGAWRTTPLPAESDAKAAMTKGPMMLYVNPTDPWDAGVSPTSGATLFIPLAFGGIGLVLLVLAAAAHRRRGVPR